MISSNRRFSAAARLRSSRWRCALRPRLGTARRVVVGPEVGVEQGLVARRRLLLCWSVVGLVVVREGVSDVVLPSQSPPHRLWSSFHARGREAREAE